MRYLCFHKANENAPVDFAVLGPKMGKLIEDMNKAGVMVSTGGVKHSANGARLRLAGDRVTVTDGPFTESKEVVGGFAIIEVKSKDEAIQWVTRFAKIIGDCEVEIRLMDHGS